MNYTYKQTYERAACIGYQKAVADNIYHEQIYAKNPGDILSAYVVY